MPTVSAPRAAGFAQAGERERRRAARRDRDQRVLVADRVMAHQRGGLLGLVLGAFDRAQQRIVPAGHQQHQALGRPAEGRHQLGAVLHRKPPRRAGAGIDQAAAGAQPLLDRQRGAFERRARGMHRGDRGELPLEHRVEDVRRVPQVDRRIARAGAFGFHHGTSPVNARDPFPVLQSFKQNSVRIECGRPWRWRWPTNCARRPRRWRARPSALAEPLAELARAAAAPAAAGRGDLRPRQLGPCGDLRQASDRALSRRSGRGGGAQYRQRLPPAARLEGPAVPGGVAIRAQRRSRRERRRWRARPGR